MEEKIYFDTQGNIVIESNGIAKVVFNKTEIEAIKLIIEEMYSGKLL